MHTAHVNRSLGDAHGEELIVRLFLRHFRLPQRLGPPGTIQLYPLVDAHRGGEITISDRKTLGKPWGAIYFHGQFGLCVRHFQVLV